jgi:hypothetical protein
MTSVQNTNANPYVNAPGYPPVGDGTSVGNIHNDPALTVAYQSIYNDPSDLNSLFDDTGNVNGQLLGDALFKLDGLGKSSADIFTLMALMIQLGKEQREGARQVRDAERETQQAELQNAADKIREAADLALAAAIVSGVFKMASGAISIGGGVHGLKGLGKDDSMENLEVIRNQGRIFDGSNQMVSATGDIMAAGFTHASTNKQAEQKEAEAAAQLAETGAQREQEFMQNLQEMISKITSLLQDIQQQNNESMKRAASV